MVLVRITLQNALLGPLRTHRFRFSRFLGGPQLAPSASSSFILSGMPTLSTKAVNARRNLPGITCIAFHPDDGYVLYRV